MSIRIGPDSTTITSNAVNSPMSVVQTMGPVVNGKHTASGKGKIAWFIGCFRRSKKLKFLLYFLTALLIINFALLITNQMTCNAGSPAGDIGKSAVDSVYLSTTQITTIGYGDICSRTAAAKLVTSIIHVFVMFLGLGLAVEFGAETALENMIQNTVDKGITSKTSCLDKLSPELQTRVFDTVGENMDDSTLGNIVGKQIKAERVANRIVGVSSRLSRTQHNMSSAQPTSNTPSMSTVEETPIEEYENGQSLLDQEQ